ncbi:LytTR family DNA-binding domain-containing protein [Sphingobacterium faecium]|uniref:LytTR family DNA-binding domain-containing protein n=1 Tax=Sphingobacterium faecium TaxID=34087 RepID=UPI003DA4BCFD
MKRTVKKTMWLVFILLSVAGGLVMYLINEHESLFEILDDQDLIKNLSISIASVALFLLVSYQSSTLVLKFVPYDQSKFAHYSWYFILQFLISGGLSLLTAICSAAVTVYANSGRWLGNTSYFSVDIYFVLLSTVFVQIVLFLIYFLVSSMQRQHRSEKLTMLLESEYIKLLQEVAVRKLEMDSLAPEKQYLQELDGIDLTDINYIYSEQKIRYIQSEVRGKTMFEGLTLSELIRVLPSDQFFLASRHLIINRSSVKSYRIMSNYNIELELNPPFHLKTTLSETATRLFKAWYTRGKDDLAE